MSRLCNYCGYNFAKRQAEKDGKIATLSRRDAEFGMGGINLYVHPPEIDIAQVDESELEQYFRSWFMELPDHCCC